MGPVEVQAILVDYLGRLVLKMRGQDLENYCSDPGRQSRQANYNYSVSGLTILALESVTGRKLGQGSREEVASG
jgi:hypothetical protein